MTDDTTIDWRELQRAAHRTFAMRIATVTDWSAPTPDELWNVHDLVAHVIEEQRWAPLLLAGRTVGEARARLQPLGDDLATEWASSSAAATEAWEHVDLDAPVRLSSDTVSAGQYLSEQVADVVVHTWDLAKATGADDRLETALVEAAWTVFEPQKDTLEASGLFASVVPIAEDAPLQSRLLALTGRDDRGAA
ncbi:MAG TPA: TIGR03086 family metal-binding protein [Microbacteriaceae bacterium]